MDNHLLKGKEQLFIEVTSYVTKHANYRGNMSIL